MTGVLIVEDDPVAQALAAELLELEGLPARLAGSGREALALAAAQWSPVVLLDLTLPDLDGWQVGERLQAMAAGRPLRIILLTANVGGEVETEARERGFFEVVWKPAPPHEMLSALRRALEGA